MRRALTDDPSVIVPEDQIRPPNIDRAVSSAHDALAALGAGLTADPAT